MARKTTTKAEAVDAVEVVPPCPLLAVMDATAALTQRALLAAHSDDIELKMTIGSSAVAMIDRDVITVAGEDENYVQSRDLASQAGLLLGAARAAAEIERD